MQKNLYVTWSHYNSAHTHKHTHFPPFTTHTHTSTITCSIVEFHGFGVVKWSNGRGWKTLLSQQALLLYLDLYVHFGRLTQKSWCIRIGSDASVLKSILSRCVSTSLSETGSKIPSREAARPMAHVKMRFNDLQKASTGGELMYRNVMKGYTRGGRSRDIDILGSRSPKRQKQSKYRFDGIEGGRR